MTAAATGNTVRFAFVGKLEDGTEFERAPKEQPLEIELGKGTLLPALEDALTGMDSGETKVVKIAAADAVGPRREELIHTVERERLPEDMDIEVGKQISATDQQGQQLNLVIVDFDDSKVTLDANHPLAGEDLTFELEVVEVK